MVALALELEVDAAVDDPLAVEALADARVAQEVGGALLEHAGAEPVLDVVARAVLEHDRLDPSRASSCASVSPAGPAPTIPTCGPQASERERVRRPDRDPVRLGELVDHRAAAEAADPALLDAAERHLRLVADRLVVHVDDARLDALRQPQPRSVSP